ncbi:MAG: pilin [Pseudomonas sp.]
MALPQYQNYVSRTRASAAAAELSGIRTAVSSCIADQQNTTDCDAGSYGIPTTASFTLTKNVTALTSVTDGVITATTGATTSAGVNLTYILTPTVTDGNIVWVNSGTTCDGGTRGFKSGQGGCS